MRTKLIGPSIFFWLAVGAVTLLVLGIQVIHNSVTTPSLSLANLMGCFFVAGIMLCIREGRAAPVAAATATAVAGALVFANPVLVNQGPLPGMLLGIAVALLPLTCSSSAPETPPVAVESENGLSAFDHAESASRS
jgi:peptidoglycan/LPS O-acetylase OafA/YrhL